MSSDPNQEEDQLSTALHQNLDTQNLVLFAFANLSAESNNQFRRTIIKHSSFLAYMEQYELPRFSADSFPYRVFTSRNATTLCWLIRNLLIPVGFKDDDYSKKKSFELISEIQTYFTEQQLGMLIKSLNHFPNHTVSDFKLF